MIKFLHAADIHLDSPMLGLINYQGSLASTLRCATRLAFERLIDLALEQQVDFVLLAGDLFDGDWRDYNTGLYFIAAMNRLNRAGIAVYMVSGNHDAASQMSRSLRLPANVHEFSTQSPERVLREDLGIEICGQGYASAAVTDDISQAYPPASPDKFSIALLHTSLDGRPGHAPYAPCSTDGLISRGYDYWALGHVHQAEIVHQSPWIVYPGNLQGRHIRETGEKGCYLVSLENGHLSQIDFISLDVVRWLVCEIDLSNCDNADTLLELVAARYDEISKQNVDGLIAMRTVFSGQTHFHDELHIKRAHWEQECRSIANEYENLWLEKIRIETSTEDKTGQQENASLQNWFSGIEDAPVEKVLVPELQRELDLFRQKLPVELLNSAEPFDPLGSQLEELISDSKSLLKGRLFQG